LGAASFLKALSEKYKITLVIDLRTGYSLDEAKGDLII
jgi:hypothetical protein